MNKIYVNFWKNKKVFLTGHSGFKGSWMSFLLTYFGAKVTGYSLKQIKKKSFYNALSLKDLLNKEYIDNICNFSKFKNAYENCQPDVVFHFELPSPRSENRRHPLPVQPHAPPRPMCSRAAESGYNASVP